MESAWVEAQLKVGLIDEETKERATQAIWDTAYTTMTAPELWTLALDAESGGNPIIPFVKRARSRLDPAASRAVHRGLTSQDVMDNALVNVIQKASDSAFERLEIVILNLERLSQRHSQTMCLARTLTQPALPTTFGLRLAQWAHALESVSFPHFPGLIQIGGAAGTQAAIVEFAGEKTDELIEEFAIDLAYHRGEHHESARDKIPWHTDRSSILSNGASMAGIIAACSRIANDVLTGCRPEVGELRLLSTGGSSAMPQKQNPTAAVLLHRNGIRAPGLLSTLASAMAETSDERSDGAWHAEWPAIAELLTLYTSSLNLLFDVIRTLDVDEAAMERNVLAASPGIISERLVQVLGTLLPTSTIQDIILDGTDVRSKLEQELDAARISETDRPDLDDLLNPRNYLGRSELLRSRIFDTSRFHRGPLPRRN